MRAWGGAVGAGWAAPRAGAASVSEQALPRVAALGQVLVSVPGLTTDLALKKALQPPARA